MRIDGMWYLCDDGGIRPVISGEVLAGDGTWVSALFLVDTGADRTVLSADLLDALGMQPVSTIERLGGVGGLAATVMVESQLRFAIEGAGKVTFKGRFAAFTDAETVDMSVLGRDILNLFTLIVDRPGNMIALLGQQHYYSIGER